jgi:hypothetical protein
MTKRSGGLREWRTIHYPSDAQNDINEWYQEDIDSRTITIRVLEGCLRKWRGLFGSVLKQYGITQGRDRITLCDEKGEEFIVAHKTCHLCRLYNGEGECDSCPIHQDCDRVYQEWCATGDPREMIAVLEEALVLEETAQQRQEEN